MLRNGGRAFRHGRNHIFGCVSSVRSKPIPRRVPISRRSDSAHGRNGRRFSPLCTHSAPVRDAKDLRQTRQKRLGQKRGAVAGAGDGRRFDFRSSRRWLGTTSGGRSYESGRRRRSSSTALTGDPDQPEQNDQNQGHSEQPEQNENHCVCSFRGSGSPRCADRLAPTVIGRMHWLT
jgi:hypothetical protein